MATPKLTPAQIERKRVDDFINARLAERRKAQVPQPQQQPNYPFGIQALEAIRPGWRMLYDILGQRQLQGKK
jgi:hypothetical protein